EPHVRALSSVGKEDDWKVGELLTNLAAGDRISESASKCRWLFLILLWAYESRDEMEDPLGFVEKVYADFDYPEGVDSFVRFMPPAEGWDPLAHTHEENERRMFVNWRKYLDTARVALG